MKDGNDRLSQAQINDARIEVRKPRGRLRRWTTDNERHLLEYVMKGLDWPDIARQLNRSEFDVQKHARIMEQGGKV